MPKKIDVSQLVGKKYGRWTIINEVEQTTKNLRRFLVKCECGNERDLNLPVLANGKSRSCGCLKADEIRDRDNYQGIKGTPIYRIWENMKTRCYNKKSEKYHCYGGRGITVCDEWLHDPKAFYDFAVSSGWTPDSQIDRKDNDGNYSPDNCRFVSREVNINNVQLLKKSNTSGYRGVKRSNSYFAACVRISGYPHFYKAGFKTAEDAAVCRDNFIIKNGIETPLNFPELRGSI